MAKGILFFATNRRRTRLGRQAAQGAPSTAGGPSDQVFLLGLVDPSQQFTTASIDLASDGEIDFACDLDDIAIALPEPGVAPMLGAAVPLLSAMVRRARPATDLTRGGRK
jgi:hypothetical protein